jgi:hypothetical protein
LRTVKTEQTSKLDSMARALTDANQRQFLSEKENERLARMNEQILREKVEAQVRHEAEVKTLRESIEERKATFADKQEEFEGELEALKENDRKSREVVEKADQRGAYFHVDSNLDQLASTVKRKAYEGDPFKKPDAWVKLEEDANDEKEDFRDKLGVLLVEKDEFISNLTVQKQKLEDIIREMEGERASHVEEIEDLSK